MSRRDGTVLRTSLRGRDLGLATGRRAQARYLDSLERATGWRLPVVPACDSASSRSSAGGNLPTAAVERGATVPVAGDAGRGILHLVQRKHLAAGPTSTAESSRRRKSNCLISKLLRDADEWVAPATDECRGSRGCRDADCRRCRGISRRKLATATRVVAAALKSWVHDRDLSRRGSEIEHCEWGWTIAVNPASPGVPAGSASKPVAGYHCRQRLCPRCNAIRARKWAQRVAPLIEASQDSGRVPKFITLTQRADSKEALFEARRRMEAAWRTLSRSKAWKSVFPRVIICSKCKHIDNSAKAGDVHACGEKGGKFKRVHRGAICSRDITYNATTGAWHYHLHIVADCDYWPRREFYRTWAEHVRGERFPCACCDGTGKIDGEECNRRVARCKKCKRIDDVSLADTEHEGCGGWYRPVDWGCYGTGAFLNIDIRRARPGTEREIVKYALKVLTVPTHLLRDLVSTLHGARTVSTTGAWRGRVKDEDLEPTIDAPEDWDLVDPALLRERAAAGDRTASLALVSCMKWLEERGSSAAHLSRAFLYPDDPWRDIPDGEPPTVEPLGFESRGRLA